VGASLIRPGYYWLAYHWENLLFSCVACNQTHKRNLFPLRDEAQKAHSPRDPFDLEDLLLIDPCRENPEAFISFRAEFAFAVDGNLRGLTTIGVFALNDRPDLIEQRRETIRILQILQEIVIALPQSPVAADARQWLNEAVMDRAEYAAMSRAFLR